MLPRLISTGLLLGVVAALLLPGRLLALSPAEERAFQRLTKREVITYRDQHAGEWMEKLSDGQSRLFFNNAQWREKAAEVEALTGQGALLRETLFATADRIVSEPIPVYSAPKEGKNDAEGWQIRYGNAMVCLSIAARLKPDEAYTAKLHAMVMAACAFDTWGREGSDGQLRNMDLAAGHMAKGLAIAYDWHRSLFNEEELELIRETMQEKAAGLLQGLYGKIFWASWYTQNHNHISVAGLGLAGAAFLGDVPEAAEWLAAADLNFQRVAVAMPTDGGIYEGLPYWGYGRSAILQYMEGTKALTGADAYYEMPFLRNAIGFRVGCSIPGFNGVLLWGDSRGHDVCGPHHLLYRLAAEYQDGQGQFLADILPFAPQGGADGVAWSVLWYDPELKPTPPVALDYHATSWDVVTSRSGWGAGAYMLSVKAGYNRNHHTKTDAGSLAFNFGGQWQLMAPGYGSSMGHGGFFDQEVRRWNFFSNRTESHSTLLIDGENQRSDIDAVGVIDRYISSPSWMLADVDLGNAYTGDRDIRRLVIHRRFDYILVFDAILGGDEARVEWLAQVPPGATVRDGGIHVRGSKGSLGITMLEGNGFVPRNTAAPVADVSASWMQSLASVNTGKDLHLIALLQPAFGQSAAAAIRADVTANATMRTVRLSASDWQDAYYFSTDGKAVSVSADVEATAAMVGTSQRADGGGWLVSAATTVRDDLLMLVSAVPFEASFEQAAEGGGLLVLGDGFSGTVQLAAGWQLVDSAGNVVPVASLSEQGTSRELYVLRSPAELGAVKEQLHKPIAEPFVAAVVPPLRTVAPYKPYPGGATIVREAEDSPMQLYGQAVVSGRGLPHGEQALLNFGSESPEHCIGWTLSVPQGGTYELWLRSAVAQPDVSVEVLLDADPALLGGQVAYILGEAGFGREKYWTLNAFDWEERPVLSAEGTPLLLQLSGGTHDLWLARPTAGINLDRLILRPVSAPASE